MKAKKVMHKWLLREKNGFEVDLHDDGGEGEASVRYVEVVANGTLVRVWGDGQVIVEPINARDDLL